MGEEARSRFRNGTPADSPPSRVFAEHPPGAFQQAWDSSPALVAVTVGPGHTLTYQNRASQALFGVRRLGQPLREAFPEVTAAGVEPLDAVLRTGQIVDVPRRQVGVRDLAGEGVVMRYVLAPLGAPGAAPGGVVITAIDVTAEARAEESAARTQLLAEISTRMSRAGDPEEALRQLTGALVPSVADVAAVYVVREPSSHDPSAAAPDGPVAISIAPSLYRLGPPPPPAGRGEPAPWDAALAAGVSVVIPVDDGTLPVVAPDQVTAAWLRGAHTHSLVVVPFVVAGALTGVLVLLAAAGRVPYTEADLAFLEDVAARAGAAITDVRVRRRLRQVAVDLQRALLPATPRGFPDLTVAARYVAGVEDVEVGGDWWDVHDLGAGRLAVGVGDVSGRGLAAAVVMGHARAAMRAAGHANLAPVEVLTLLDAQVSELVEVGDHDQGAPPRFATACYGVVEPAQQVLRVASAGHPPPLVRSPAGAVEAVWVPPGAPLGLQIGGYVEVTVPFTAGSTLAMFTDGLVESRTQDLDVGTAALAAALAREGGAADLEATADALLDAMGRRDGHEDDDVAMVLVRLEPSAAVLAALDVTVARAADLASSREVVAKVVQQGGAGALTEVAEQVATELLANALEHGMPPVRLHVHVTGTRVVIEVSDRGLEKPVHRAAGAEDARGRGLVVTAALASRWGTRMTSSGKTVWGDLARP